MSAASLAIRPYLAQISGVQSRQYRCIELALGNKNAAMPKPHSPRTDLLAVVEATGGRPRSTDESLRLLSRHGSPVPASQLERDRTQPYPTSDDVEALWLVVFPNPEAHWDLYQLGEELTDLEDAFRLWRFRHVTLLPTTSLPTSITPASTRSHHLRQEAAT